MKNTIKSLAAVAAFAVLSWAQTNPLNMTTMQVVKDMGLGINLGNTFESWPTWAGANWTTVNDVETGWGSPTVTKAMIDSYKNNGFKTVRIPVAWSNLMTGISNGGSYTINASFLDRVGTVIDWVLENNMYAIVNIHWDGGWWENFPTDSANCMSRYKKMWTQIADKYKSKSGYLIFESLNEEGVWNSIWDRYSGSTGANKTRAYNMLNAINQEFTTLVRASGGNNGTRHLLIAGYATDINLTTDAAFKLPTDAQNRRAVSVHYYDPFGFTHLNQNESWANMQETWGSTADVNELNNYMNKLKTTFVDKGIPVIVGEYGFAGNLTGTRNATQVRNYTVAVATAIYNLNMCPVLWDTQNNDQQYYNNRNANPPGFYDAQLITQLKAIVPAAPSSSSVTPSSSSRIASSSSRAASSSSIAVSSSSRAVSSSSRAVSSSSRAVSSSSRAVSSSSRAVSSSSRAVSSSSRAVSSSSRAVSSSSRAVSSSSRAVSSSSNGTTPIIQTPIPNSESLTEQYYSLQGRPLGNTEPKEAGVYIVKNGYSVKKIVVR